MDPNLIFFLFKSVLLLEGATDKFTGDEACRIYLQAAIVYERVRLTVFRRGIGSMISGFHGPPT